MHEIVTDDDGNRHGTDGVVTVSLLAQDGRMFKRRGVKGMLRAMPGDKVLPRLNELAGELLNNLDMDGDTLALKLHALAELCKVPKPVEVNMLVAELSGVRVYQYGQHVIITYQDLYP